MEKDKASTPNKGKDIHVGSDSDFEMGSDSGSDSDFEKATEPTCRLEKDKFSLRASNMENEIEQARASNMENDIEQARASNMEEDKASSSNKGKLIDGGNASDIEMAMYFLATLKIRAKKTLSAEYSTEKRRRVYSIYRVPEPLRNVNQKAYAPLLIAIGPFHRKNERLKAMKKEKLKYFNKLSNCKGMKDIVICIKNQERRLRNCYSEKSILMESSDDFVEMILLDAIFIIQFFLESNGDIGSKRFEPRMTFDIREDLLLLENQLPLFIIKEIYDRLYPCSQDVKAIPFLDLASRHFGKYSFLKGETSPGVKGETSPGVGVKGETSPGVKGSRHFTDLLRNLMLCKTSPDIEKVTSPVVDVEKVTSPVVDVEKVTSPDVEKETTLGVEGSRHLTDLLRNLILSRAIQRSYSLNPPMLKYSVVMLRKAGVRFQVSTRDKCMVNITFEKGVLKIPQLEVDHNFERLVRNIMAMEQCCYSSEAYICSYIKFMDHLIDSAEDVSLLVGKGIIVHRLGDDAAVSKMINNLCENIDNHSCFGDISQKLNDHYDSPFNRAIASLVLGYFPNIWIGTGTVAAAILLILTLIQTINSF